MTSLLLCGTGSTGLAIAKLLRAADHPVILTSRTGKAPEPYKAATFDWLDHATFENPFKEDSNIDRVYIVSPTIYDMLPHAKAFIDLAITKGVKRFVLLSESQLGPGDPYTGKIHEYLLEIGVDYFVLRPTWFTQNFGRYFYFSIREQNEIFSATGNGRIPWLSIDDLANLAFEALTAEKCPNKDSFIFGPELYTYDEIAEIFTDVLGRKITHKKLTPTEFAQLFTTFGITPVHADLLASMEQAVADGVEEGLFNSSPDKKYLGTYKLSDYIRENKELWIKE
ncbi:NAD(P)-binding protein [Pholiota conissans]|uniref:NAD(P)-binding protein n=1 Tax=Pholiota conissans TaxID=109636 RepID=A0A9P5Z750_9AGAR|nr:NAD(P)-binding protein [Pholiota conissans]